MLEEPQKIDDVIVRFTPETPSVSKSRAIIGLCFAIPATVFAMIVFNLSLHDIWHWAPISAALGTFLTAYYLWHAFTKPELNILSGMFAGMSIGVLAHPVSAMISLLILFLLDTNNNFPNMNSGEYFTLVALIATLFFTIFWWCLMVFLSVGWITLAIGAGVGGLIGLIEIWQELGSYNRMIDQRNKAFQEDSSVAKQIRKRSRASKRDDSLIAGLISLSIISIFSLLILLSFSNPMLQN